MNVIVIVADTWRFDYLLDKEPEAAREVHEALMKFVLSLRASKP